MKKKPQEITCGFLARQKGLEPPTFRLGGGRSIQLSYWRIYWSIVPKNSTRVNRKQNFAYSQISAETTGWILYTEFLLWKGGKSMCENNIQYADIDDWIYCDVEGGPSER